MLKLTGRARWLCHNDERMALYDVFGMCNPLIDLLAEADDDLLTSLGFAKGSMNLVDESQQRALLSAIGGKISGIEPGGSGANTMIGLALLGGRGVYTGHVGLDDHARHYRSGLEAKGVKANLGADDGMTGTCLVVISPDDAERTMFTFLGNCLRLGRQHVDEQDLRASSYLYVTGYLWDTDTQKEAVLHAMHSANREGVKVALSLSDSFCVGRHRHDFSELAESHVDLLIGNEAEATAMAETDEVYDAVRRLRERCDMVAVTLGANGSLVAYGDTILHVPAYPATPVDMTGAGDMYAAGLLYGLTHNIPLEKTGKLANYAAAQVVSKLGPRLEALQVDLEGLD